MNRGEGSFRAEEAGIGEDAAVERDGLAFVSVTGCSNPDASMFPTTGHLGRLHPV